MKTDKATKAPHIILMTKRFNEVSIIICHFVHQYKTLSVAEIPDVVLKQKFTLACIHDLKVFMATFSLNKKF
jgi:hypothetical protein